METDFIIYPEAVEKLEKSGLKERVEKAIKKHYDMFYGATFKEEILALKNEMEAEGYFSGIPAGIKKIFGETLNGLFSNSSDYAWTIQRPEGDEKVEASDKQILMFLGYYASYVLKPDEFWEYEKFGFDSFSEMHGAITLHMKEATDSKFREGYIWKSKSDEKDFQTRVTGSIHGDLRIFRTDITDYPTLDVFGNSVPYRPVSYNKDYHVVAGYHSVEPYLLIHLLKYIEQGSIEVDLLKDNAKEFLDEIKKNPQFVGPYADFGMGSDVGVTLCFSNFFWEIPNFKKEKHTRYFIATEFRGSYGLFVDDNKNLLFFRRPENSTEYNLALTFPPDETEELIKGLFIQASKGLGRTSVKQLAGVIEYYFSDKFKEHRKNDEEEFRKLEENSR